jgi:hypothetical protein
MRLLASTLAALAVAHPHVLATGRGTVYGIAQDGGRVAWATQHAVRIRRIGARRGAWFPVDKFALDCCEGLALAGGRALWAASAAGNDIVEDVSTGSVDDPRQHFVREAEAGSTTGGGTLLGGMAGDGRTLVFSVVNGVVVNEPCDDPSCTFGYRGGGIWRMVGRRAVRIGRIPGTPWLAAAGSRIATVTPSRGPFAPTRLVQVRQASNGDVISMFAASAPVRRIALTPRLVAVVVADDPKGALALEWFDPDTGARLGSRGLPASLRRSPVLSASGSRILFAESNDVELLDTRTNTARRLFRIGLADAPPVLDGNRVVWAHNVADLFEIRELVLGR